MTKTYKDFNSREEFTKSLNLYHYDRTRSDPDYSKIFTAEPSKFQNELLDLVKNINDIKKSWNNQSIQHIEESVSKKGQRHLDIMQGQKTDKLAAGYRSDAPMYRINNCDANSYFYQLANCLGLERSLARYHVQFPGEVTVWHTDIFSPAHEFLAELVGDIPDEKIGQDNNIGRVLIALEDWDWGHMMVFGKTPWINWNAGDVIYWNYGVPHGSANMGFKPRISVSITGIITDKFRKAIADARQ